MRHAKSSWDDPTQDDHDRPLNERGRVGAAEIGHLLRSENVAPEQIFSSDARRTVETVRLLGLESVEPTFTPKLYHASPDVLLDTVQSASAGTVMVVGHNPGIAEFAEKILSVQPQHPRFLDYPTAATLFAKFEIESWKDLRLGTGVPLAFAIPGKVKPSEANS